MKRVRTVLVLGLLAASVAGCAHTYYGGDYGRGYHYDRDRDGPIYQDRGYDRDADRASYWRDGHRYCGDGSGDYFRCDP